MAVESVMLAGDTVEIGGLTLELAAGIGIKAHGPAAGPETAPQKMREFTPGEIDDIPELSDLSLPIKRLADGSIWYANLMEEIASSGRIS